MSKNEAATEDSKSDVEGSKPQDAKSQAAQAKKEGLKLWVPPLKLVTMRVAIIGTSPIIVHKLSEKAKHEMEAKQQANRKAVTPPKEREPRDPHKEFVDAQYINSKGEHCMRACAFKGSVVEGVRFIPGNAGGKEFPKTIATPVFQVLGELQPLIAPPPEMRTDSVKLESGVTSLSYRPAYWPWGVLLTIQYSGSLLNEEGILNLLSFAGFHSGVHDWRPNKGGNFGMYRPANIEELQSLREEVLSICKETKAVDHRVPVIE